ncbi:SDR family oxidoreductase [Enterovirga rhinocerotis]|uniref:NAD(P)-dependent dehydrogenase (Short-subunit alcohol dehydrogenase family) n=1 Tax=Enterovirga rhinocerotis TaxID=1339210 RepID=A0A4V3DZ22_9HYPH|nr:SDR family oxidoreductase [Enterovirga rhinocerotis]TDR94789.1 NAD(P)-dependent dehydrogenase (short-subunit alcohol dehydrogenase family) [Enterovirga rhinocerotis]
MVDSRPVVVVTGGSRGIGAAVSRLAAARGFDVAVNYRSEAEAAERVVADCRAAGARACAIQGDMAVQADIVALFDKAAAELGPIAHLVNNAGVTGKSSTLAEASPDVIRSSIDINVTGVILVAREAARRISTRRGGPGGSIVNISSVAAEFGSPNEYVWYAASKGAVDSLTIGLSKELAPDGIRVNTVAPGMTMTDIHERSTEDAGRIERIRPHIPLQRIGEPEEIAEAVVFMMSDAASYISGAKLKVSGGR